MAEYCESCEQLKEYAANFIINGITEKECDSLKKDTGLNPNLSVLHTNCEDLNDLNDCLLGALKHTLEKQSVCDWQAFTNQLMENLQLLTKALICSDCGQWLKIHELEDSINQLWAKMAKVEAALDNLAAQNWAVNAQYVIDYSTPGMSVSIDRKTGDFVFYWSDWLDSAFTQKLGQGAVRGTVHFGMGQESGLTAKWQVRSVTINSCSYTSNQISDVNRFIINLYVKKEGEEQIYRREHRTLESFTDTINQTIDIGMKGILPTSSTSGWIQFFELFNDNPETTLDDRANVQIQFANNNKQPIVPYI